MLDCITDLYYIADMTSIRFTHSMEMEMTRIAEQTGITKSDLVKEAVAEYLSRFAAGTSPYTLGQDLFGRHASGDADLASGRKEKLQTFLQDKHEKRSAD